MTLARTPCRACLTIAPAGGKNFLPRRDAEAASCRARGPRLYRLATTPRVSDLPDATLKETPLPEQIGYYFEDLAEGMTASYAKTVTDADIVLFAGVSGDTNPVHLNDEFARETMFKGRIAHGMLSASLISTVFGTKMPGPGCIYMSQTLRFKAPVRPGDTVTARVTVVELKPEKKQARFDCVCLVNGKAVLDGEAIILVPSRPVA